MTERAALRAVAPFCGFAAYWNDNYALRFMYASTYQQLKLNFFERKLLMSLLRVVRACGLAFAAVALMAGCDNPSSKNPGGENNPGNIVYNPDGSGGDSRLVGDWLNNHELYYVTLTSSGIFINGLFQRVENFWVYVVDDVALWRADGQFLYIDLGEGEYKFSYSISGNKLTLNSEEENGEMIKFDRRTLGTVYGKDPVLLATSKRHAYLSWVLQGDDRQVLKLNGWDFHDERGYYSDGKSSGQWYTNGTRLFLLYGDHGDWVENDEDGQYYRRFAVESRVEFDYKITGIGDNRTLTLRRVLPNGQIESADIWKAVEHDYDDPWGDDYDYSPAKSKQGKNKFTIGSGIFQRLLSPEPPVR
jgi:hypothetical protein